MKPLSDEHRAVSLVAIVEDAGFMVRTMRAAQRSQERHRSVPAMALLPTFSLMTWETRAWLTQYQPDIAAMLPGAEWNVIMGIRNAAKWLDSSRAGVEASLQGFRDVVAESEEEFLGNTPYRWARGLESDLGRYTLRGRDILNTHAFQLLLGPGPRPDGPTFKEVGVTIGRQAASLSDVDPLAASFIDDVGMITSRDSRSTKYYSRGQEARLDVSGYLHAVWSSLAFLRLVRPVLPADEGPVFKMRFIGLYYADSTLRRLAPAAFTTPNPLTATQAGRQLRNELVHYKPNSFTPIEALDPHRPRQALVEHALQMPIGDARRKVDDDINEMYENLAAYLGRRP